MIVMFTSPAYSAVPSNNLQSRYPEGWCRLKMSNLFFLRHWMRRCSPDNSVVVRLDTSCYTLLHPHQKIQKLMGKACQGWSMIVPRGYVRSPTQVILYFSGDGGMMKHMGKDWSRSSYCATSARPNPARSTCAPTSPSKVDDPPSFS